jgi:hypothetical protein
MINTTYPSQYMALWLKASHPSSPSSCATNNSKAEGYSVVQINNIPTVTSAISVMAPPLPALSHLGLFSASQLALLSSALSA